MPTKKGIKRIQFNATKAENDRIKNVKKMSGITTKTGIASEALRVYELILENNIKGKSIITKDVDGKKEEIKLLI